MADNSAEKVQTQDEKPVEQECASPKKAGNRGKIIGIVVAVVVVLGIGFTVWHNQPSFCNTVCHVPMDHTVQSYYSGDAKYGVTVHAQNNKACLDCHTANIGDQITEGTKWITGDYNYDSKTGQTYNVQDGLLVSYSDKFATAEFCLRSGCHTSSDGSAITSEDQLKASTADKSLNPHDFSYHGEVACGTCHKMHQQSVFVCTECHNEASSVVPDGWLAGSNEEASL